MIRRPLRRAASACHRHAWYATWGRFPNPRIDPQLFDEKLSDDEPGKLVACLGSLACLGTLTPAASQ